MSQYTVTFERASDKKVFKSTDVSHWTSIKAEDGEEDSVKWFGPEPPQAGYVSASKGHTYVKVAAGRE